jgi:hypothetical protein
MLLINVYHGGQILNTSTGVCYDLKRQIHAGLELLPSQFTISISAQINTAPAGSGDFFIAYLRLFLMKFGDD